MKIKYFIFYLVIIWGLYACNEKLQPDKVREQLIEYGNKNPENIIVIKTKLGVIKCRLYEETPLHRANFIRLIKQGYYDEAEFYRVIHRFMIQGGDLGKLSSRTETTMIPEEFNTKFFHKRGALAMARPDENNPQKQSSPTEFYIIQGTKYDSSEVIAVANQYKLIVSADQMQAYTTVGGDMTLDQRYTVFGEVIEGLEIVDKIAIAQTYQGDKPIKKIPFEIQLSFK